MQTLHAGCSKTEAKIFTPPQIPSRGVGRPKFSQLEMVTTFTYKQFGDDQCMQFRVILVTDPPTHKQTNAPSHKQTDRINYNILCRSFKSRSIIVTHCTVTMPLSAIQRPSIICKTGNSCCSTSRTCTQQHKEKCITLSLCFKGHFPGEPRLAGSRMSPFWILLELRVMEVVVTTGAISRAKLQSNHHHQQTNIHRSNIIFWK